MREVRIKSLINLRTKTLLTGFAFQFAKAGDKVFNSEKEYILCRLLMLIKKHIKLNIY